MGEVMKKLVLTLTFTLIITGCSSFSDTLRDFAVGGDEAEAQEQQAEQMAEQKAQQNKAEMEQKSQMAEREVDPTPSQTDEAHMGEMPSMTMVETVSDMPAPEMTNSHQMMNDKAPQVAATQAPSLEAQQAMMAKKDQAQKVQQALLAKQSMGQFNQTVMRNKRRQLQESVENDYYVFQAVNHAHIKNNTPANQYKSLNMTLSHFVMDLIENMSPEHYEAELVVRPLKLKVANVANPDGGREIITTVLAAQIRDYGFSVFDGRRPKGRFTGDELILETSVENYGEQFVLYGTLKRLGSNKVAGTHQTFISDYFFRNIKDGVEVFETQNEFGR